MATSKHFLEQVKTGNVAAALQTALENAGSLKIVTHIAGSGSGSDVPASHQICTHIDAVAGTIETVVGEQFLQDGAYKAICEGHMQQVVAGCSSVRDNLDTIQALLDWVAEDPDALESNGTGNGMPSGFGDDVTDFPQGVKDGGFNDSEDMGLGAAALAAGAVATGAAMAGSPAEDSLLDALDSPQDSFDEAGSLDELTGFEDSPSEDGGLLDELDLSDATGLEADLESVNLESADLESSENEDSFDLSNDLGFGSDLGSDLGDDFGGDVGGDLGGDFGNNLGGDFGSDLGGDLGGDFGSDLGLENDLGSDLGGDFGSDLGLDNDLDLGSGDGSLQLGADDLGADDLGLDLGDTANEGEDAGPETEFLIADASESTQLFGTEGDDSGSAALETSDSFGDAFDGALSAETGDDPLADLDFDGGLAESNDSDDPFNLGSDNPLGGNSPINFEEDTLAGVSWAESGSGEGDLDLGALELGDDAATDANPDPEVDDLALDAIADFDSGMWDEASSETIGLKEDESPAKVSRSLESLFSTDGDTAATAEGDSSGGDPLSALFSDTSLNDIEGAGNLGGIEDSQETLAVNPFEIDDLENDPFADLMLDDNAG